VNRHKKGEKGSPKLAIVRRAGISVVKGFVPEKGGKAWSSGGLQKGKSRLHREGRGVVCCVGKGEKKGVKTVFYVREKKSPERPSLRRGRSVFKLSS